MDVCLVKNIFNVRNINLTNTLWVKALTNKKKSSKLLLVVSSHIMIVFNLQGFCVSCLFCFANQDVAVALSSGVRRLCPQWFGGPEPATAYTGTLGDFAPAFVNGNTQRDVVVWMLALPRRQPQTGKLPAWELPGQGCATQRLWWWWWCRRDILSNGYILRLATEDICSLWRSLTEQNARFYQGRSTSKSLEHTSKWYILGLLRKDTGSSWRGMR